MTCIFRLMTLAVILFGITANAQTNCPAKRIEDCPAEGCGGWDRQLDVKKNLTADPKSQAAKQFTLEEIKQLEYPRQWFMGKDRTELEALKEGVSVQVTAYLVGVKYGGLESANCKLTELSAVNNLLILVSEDALDKKPSQREATSVTAVITARVRLRHVKQEAGKPVSNWTKEKLEAWIRSSPKKARLVRITGLLLLDTEHIYNPLVRATDWQIYPIFTIEGCDKGTTCVESGEWKSLDSIHVPIAPRRTRSTSRIPE